MDEYMVTNRECMDLLRQRMCSLFWKIAEEREAVTVDGVPGYNEKAQFAGGKVINLCTYVALNFAGMRMNGIRCWENWAGFWICVPG